MTNTTIITTPHLLSPINDLWGNYFQLDNAGSAAENFKYLVRLYANSSLLVKEILPPRPTTGYGLYSPYKTLLTRLSFNINYGITQSTLNTNQIVNYYIQAGLEYNPGLTFGGYVTSILAVGGITGSFGLSFSSVHGLQVGDLITVQTENPYISGTSTVTQILTSASIAINKGFTTSSNVSNGAVSDVQRWNGTSSIYYGYNGTRQYGERSINHFTNEVICSEGSPIISMTLSAGTTTGYVTGDTFSVVGGDNNAVGSVVANLGIVSQVIFITGGSNYFPGIYSTDVRTGFGVGLAVEVKTSAIPIKPFLSEFLVDNYKTIMPNQSENLSAFLYPTSFSNGSFATTYTFYNSNNTLIGLTAINRSISSSPKIQRWDIPVGTDYITSIGASTSTAFYEVKITPTYNRYTGPIDFWYIGGTISGPYYSTGQQVRLNGGDNNAVYQIVAAGGIPLGGSFLNYGTGYTVGNYTTTNITGGTGVGFEFFVASVTPTGMGVTYSETRKFKIDNSCSMYNNTRMVFMNKFGAFDYFNFRKNNIKSYTITRNEFKKNLPIDYNIGDRQKTIMSSTLVESHTVYSDYVTEDEYATMQAAFSTNEAFIVDELTGDTYPIIITDTQWTFKTLLNERLFNVQLTYVTSYDINRQGQ